MGLALSGNSGQTPTSGEEPLSTLKGPTGAFSTADSELFPGPRHLWWVAGLISVAILVRLIFLGYPDLIDPSESRFATSAQQMVASGNYVTPMIHSAEGHVAYGGKPEDVWHDDRCCAGTRLFQYCRVRADCGRPWNHGGIALRGASLHSGVSVLHRSISRFCSQFDRSNPRALCFSSLRGDLFCHFSRRFWASPGVVVPPRIRRVGPRISGQGASRGCPFWGGDWIMVAWIPSVVARARSSMAEWVGNMGSVLAPLVCDCGDRDPRVSAIFLSTGKSAAFRQ
jgi:hypothetical protein